VITKLESGKWEARGWENSAQYRRRFQTKKAAEQYELEVAKREERRRNGLPAPPKPITYHELGERYLAQHNTQSKKWFAETLAYSTKEFGSLQLSALRGDEIGAWLHALPLAPKTRKHIYDCMKQVLAAAVEWGYLPKNPVNAKSVRPPRASDPDVRPFTSWAEIDMLAAHAPDIHGPLITFACATGLRPEEWIALRTTDIDLTARTVQVDKVVVDGELRTDRGKTDAAFRIVLLQQKAIDALSELGGLNGSGAVLFPNTVGGYLDLDNWRRRIWHPTLKNAGLLERPLYQCRHTYATLALSAGCDLYWVSRQLGHTNIGTTLKFYARFQRAVDDRNLAALDAAA
jgi:integrase